MATEVWKGVYKLQEEMGELQQALGKLCVYTSGKHPDGKDWRKQLIEELADVEAAITYFRNINLNDEERRIILARCCQKVAKFQEWGLSGVKTK